jgi:hypothetical protein
MKLFYPDPPRPADRVITIPDEFIAEVILGLCIPKDHMKEIVGECKERNIRVFSTEKVPFEFKIKRTEI